MKKLKSLDCMRGLSDHALNLLESVCFERSCSTSTLIWTAGDRGNSITVVASGLIEVIRHTRRSEETCVGVFGPSDVLGISAVLNKTSYPGTARTVSRKAEIFKIGLPALLNQKGPAFSEIQNWTLEMLLRHEKLLTEKIDILAAGKIDNRVFELVVHLVRRFGKKESGDRIRIPMGLTRAQVGKIVDARTETVIRLINRWRADELIDWNQDRIVIPHFKKFETQYDQL
jgi:CRP-like cAMP-binding protein